MYFPKMVCETQTMDLGVFLDTETGLVHIFHFFQPKENS